MADRRTSPRQRSYLGARVAFDRRRATMDGLVRNLSAGGVRLAFPSTVMLPAELDLIVPHTGLDTRVRLVWRSGDALGLAFLDPERDGDIVPIGVARRLRAITAENIALKRRLADLTGA